MGRFPPLLVGALSALHILGATAQAPQPPPTPQASGCILACTNQLKAKFQDFNCKNADDAGCLCKNQNFGFGVRDCSANCITDKSAKVDLFPAGSFCAGHLPAQSSAPTREKAAPASSQSPHPTNAQPSATPTSIQGAPATTRPSSTSSAAHVATGTAPASSTSATSASSATSDSPISTTTSAAAASDSAGSGLPQSTVVGIGLGVGGAVIALASIGVGLLLRGRKRKPRPSMEISKPLPGSGRTYGGRGANSFEKYGNDIEMTTNRYEDMVPRQQPRTMV